MRVTKSNKSNSSIEVDVLCNKCGGSCKDYVDAAHKHYNFNHATMKPEFGYGSLRYDMTSWDDVHLCENCYAEIESTFALKPEKKVGFIV